MEFEGRHSSKAFSFFPKGFLLSPYLRQKRKERKSLRNFGFGSTRERKDKDWKLIWKRFGFGFEFGLGFGF